MFPTPGPWSLLLFTPLKGIQATVPADSQLVSVHHDLYHKQRNGIHFVNVLLYDILVIVRRLLH